MFKKSRKQVYELRFDSNKYFDAAEIMRNSAIRDRVIEGDSGFFTESKVGHYRFTVKNERQLADVKALFDGIATLHPVVSLKEICA